MTSIYDKLNAVPLTLQYQGQTLYLLPELKEISGLCRVVFVNRAGVTKFMSFIGENTNPIDWSRIEAENTAPHEFTPDESDTQRAISMFKSWERRKQAQFKAILDERK